MTVKTKQEIEQLYENTSFTIVEQAEEPNYFVVTNGDCWVKYRSEFKYKLARTSKVERYGFRVYQPGGKANNVLVDEAVYRFLKGPFDSATHKVMHRNGNLKDSLPDNLYLHAFTPKQQGPPVRATAITATWKQLEEENPEQVRTWFEEFPNLLVTTTGDVWRGNKALKFRSDNARNKWMRENEGFVGAFLDYRLAKGMSTDGYKFTEVKGVRQYRCSRLVYMICNKERIADHPKAFIDHIDGNKVNDALSNLRLANAAQNSQNRRTPQVENRDPTLPRGVRYKNKNGTSRRPWIAAYNGGRKVIEGKTIYSYHPVDGKKIAREIGCYETKEEASAAYLKYAAEIEGEYNLGFSRK